jgi:hypothetical protein
MNLRRQVPKKSFRRRGELLLRKKRPRRRRPRPSTAVSFARRCCAQALACFAPDAAQRISGFCERRGLSATAMLQNGECAVPRASQLYVKGEGRRRGAPMLSNNAVKHWGPRVSRLVSPCFKPGAIKNSFCRDCAISGISAALARLLRQGRTFVDLRLVKREARMVEQTVGLVGLLLGVCMILRVMLNARP